MEEITKLISNKLNSLGFDLVKPFPTQRYNENLPANCKYEPLPTFSQTKSTLSILVGNTKYLWPKFLKYYYTEIFTRYSHPRYTTSSNHCASSTSYSEGSDNEEYKQQNPLDYYTRVSMESIIEEIIQVNNLKYDVRYPFDLNEKRFVAFQVMAENASLAYYNRVCFLNIHEEYGPWIGLRAVITLDMEGPPNSSQLFPELKNPFPEGDKILERKLSEIFGSKDHYYHQQPDDPETMDVNQKDGNNISDMKLEIKNEWYKFVELRDIASRFMDKKSLDNWRYSEDQMEYHYTNNIEFLNNLFN